MFKRFAVALAVALLPASAEICPWMNAATAGALLGGEVTVHVAHASGDNDDAGCTFERTGGERLAIDVTTMRTPQTEFASYSARCPHGAPLKAIGNEALSCGGADQGRRWELVVGRVRDRAFIVRLSMKESDVRERARKAAEQVAGILF